MEFGTGLTFRVFRHCVCSVQASGEEAVLVPTEEWPRFRASCCLSLGIQESMLVGDKAHVGRGGGTEVWLQEERGPIAGRVRTAL